MKSIYSELFCLLKNETTKISKRAYDVLNSEGIADILQNDGVFWFETYISGNICTDEIYSYLKKFIKRKMKLEYLYDLTKIK